MTLSPHLLEDLVRALAVELAPLVAAAISQDDARACEDEPWRLLGLDEAATRLGRSTRWVRDRVKAHELPYVRLDGGAFAFEIKDLHAFARARRVVLQEPGALAARLQAAHEPASANGFRKPHQVHDRRVSP